jgi:hypothetical protein
MTKARWSGFLVKIGLRKPAVVEPAKTEKPADGEQPKAAA